MTQSTDIHGAADFLGITVPTVNRRLKAGTFPVPDATDGGIDWWTIETLETYQKALKRKTRLRKKRV